MMANNKQDLTIEELEKQYKAIGEQLQQKRQDEEDKRKAQLALEQERRKTEVDNALDKYYTLLDAYIKDYGRYSTKRIKDGLADSFWRF